MSLVNQKQAAKAFAEHWQAEEGNEERQARSFLIDFLQDALGINNPTKVLDFERRVKGRKIDAFYEDMGILLEAKSREPGILDKQRDNGKYGLETPYQQAKWYANELPASIKPRWIIVTDFNEFRIHDLDLENPEQDYISVKLEELPEQLYLFDFFFDKSKSRLVKEREVSVEAGEIVGRLYKSLSAQYKNIDSDKQEQRSLNILIVRFVFLLYAEDAGILQERNAFLNYMLGIEPEDMRRALIELFEILDTPDDARDPYLSEKLAAFPYINGSLFAERDIIIPQFTQQIKFDLLKEASQEFDWSGISPTIFGAAFESTLNPDTRREGGMHYTSIENIHKVIDPLFLDDLKTELAEIEGEKVEKSRNLKLRQFQNKLASLEILDPACGSGNFLTESYLSLRRLENRVLENLMGDQVGLNLDGDASPIKVTIDQLFGIEINEFAVAVAKTALWIAEEQMMDKTQEILFNGGNNCALKFLPLKSNDNIVQGNALRMDWNDVLPAQECAYVIGNPPFVGKKYQSKEQKDEIKEVFDKQLKGYGVLDYVNAWFMKTVENYINQNPIIKGAFVATSSIIQGEQAVVMFPLLKDKYDIDINYAYEPFKWESEAKDTASVIVIIIGFGRRSEKDVRLFRSNEQIISTNSLNVYLIPGTTSSICARRKSLNAPQECVYGSFALDGGHFTIDENEYKQLISNDPDIAPFLKPFLGSEEVINDIKRYCVWIDSDSYAKALNIPVLAEKIRLVKDWRNSRTRPQTVKAAETPYRFAEIRQPNTSYLAIPITSSENRDYIPLSLLSSDVIGSNHIFMIPNSTLYELGILHSQFHNAWMRTVAGRMKTDYNYSAVIVYNNFIWPNPTDGQRAAIEACAQGVLDARDAHPGKSLADLYDPDKMPADLLAAHKALDAAVEAAYGVDFGGDEEKIVAHLFILYAAATSKE